MPTTTPETDGRVLIPGPEARYKYLGGIGWTKYCGLINDGELERVFIGRRSFVTAESLHAYIERLRNANRPPTDEKTSAAPIEAPEKTYVERLHSTSRPSGPEAND